MENYESMTTAELRAKGRELRNNGDTAFGDVSGVAIAGMLRSELIARMTGMYQKEIIDVTPKPNNSNGNHGTMGTTGNDAELIDVLARVLGDKLKAPKADLDEERVIAIVKDILNNSNFGTKDVINTMNDAINELRDLITNRKQELEIKLPNLEKVNVGIQHEIFPKLLKRLAMRKHIFLVGPSGSGKTHIAQGLAKALNLSCYYMLVGEETSKADFFGYKNLVDGTYQETDFYKAYVNGGLILIDEIDAGSPNTMTMLNMALDNGICAFPCGMREKHPDFCCIASGNTYGRGADAIYCGRNPLDGATKQRFKVIFMDYDTKLEAALCPDQNWVKKIHLLREVVAEHKAKIIVSMRAVIEGYELLAAGESEDDILDETVFQGYSKDAVLAIKRDWKERIAA